MRKSVAAAAMAGSLLAGGALGVALLGPTSAIGQTTSTTTPSNGGNGGTFRSNEDPAHEATESPAREADEDAGRGGFGRCHHMRGAEEHPGQTPSTPAPSPAPSGSPSV